MTTHRICCLSDLHGHYPEVPDCDLLLLGGDYCTGGDYFARMQNHRSLCEWIACLSSRMQVIGIAGNHDVLFEKTKYANLPQAKWEYLEDSGTVWNGLNVWGTPWQPRFFDWAYNLDEPELSEKWALIPDNTDILVVHGPPQGVADFSPFGKVHTGSPSLLHRIQQIQPKLVVCGHIHSGYGQYKIGSTLLASSSLVDEQYKAANAPQVIELSY